MGTLMLWRTLKIYKMREFFPLSCQEHSGSWPSWSRTQVYIAAYADNYAYKYMLSKLAGYQSNCMWNGILTGNLVLISVILLCLATIVLKQLYESKPFGWLHKELRLLSYLKLRWSSLHCCFKFSKHNERKQWKCVSFRKETVCENESTIWSVFPDDSH